MKDRKFDKTPEWLFNEYVIKDRTIAEIAKECNLTRAGLKSTLNKYNIRKPVFDRKETEIRNLLAAGKTTKEISELLNIGRTTIYRVMKKNNLEINYKPDFKKYNSSNDSIICSMYLDGFSTTEIAVQLNITAKSVGNHLRHCEIKVRNAKECQWNYRGKQIPEEFDSYDKMYELYITEKKSKKELGNMFGMQPDTIDRVLRTLGIPVRDNSESKIGINCGEKHPNWKGGITPLYMRLREAFQTQLCPKILKRDNYTCQLCGAKGTLHVHHIRHFKDIVQEIMVEHPDINPVDNINELYDIIVKDSRFLDENNLITYCPHCHYTIAHKRY